ncbi:flagellar biosynthesis anti-sigma factor FlgM [Sphingomonas aracearum]|uniref:Negative regulator of flagellin synthesis n=1 Tax=Sphingomonas aracearum TaxID=2283317 RepID=A0A369VU26_9SPHN|nr:flagellar biosynthesis anti-sigma factor FlgM [Sphingomonas aracearum]RDE05886.1 flagellar biosynthesis anti-sigma factor FlgM [Sphingomonas aracearum]
MVEPLGTKPVLTADRTTVSRVDAPLPAPRVTASPADTGSAAAASTVAAQASAAAARPPVNTDRVAEIKRAIANGTFPILPAKIADAMIALKIDWMTPNEQA